MLRRLAWDVAGRRATSVGDARVRCPPVSPAGRRVAGGRRGLFAAALSELERRRPET